MANRRIVILRAWFVAALGVLFYPLVLLTAILITIFDAFIKPKQEKDIKGAVAVVFGASQNLSKQIAQQLAAKGCHVALVERQLNDTLSETAESLSAEYNVKAKVYQIDSADCEQVFQLNELVKNELGLATIFINNVDDAHLIDRRVNIAAISEFINNNYTTQFWINRVFLQNMKLTKNGNIVAICSADSVFPLLSRNLYCSTKHALRTSLNVLRLELRIRRRLNIGVTFALHSTQSTPLGLVSLNSSPKNVAERIVSGFLKYESEIVIPGFLKWLYRLYEFLPLNAQIFLSQVLFSAVDKIDSISS